MNSSYEAEQFLIYLDYIYIWYLDLLQDAQPMLLELARFRTGSHKLAVETGRWHGVARENRLCQVCKCGLVEDESHFLFDCEAYRDIRLKYRQLFSNIRRKDLGGFLNSEDQFSVAKFIYWSMRRRKEKVG